MEGERIKTTTASGVVLRTLLDRLDTLVSEKAALMVELEVERQESGRLREQLRAAAE